jgi:hypothetical protein
MTDKATVHPSEDDLTAFALEGTGTGIGNHVAGCVSCRKFVSDISALRSTLVALDTEEPSIPLGRRFALRPPVSPSVSLIDSFLAILLKTPAMLAFFILIYIILAFFIYNYLNDLAMVK